MENVTAIPIYLFWPSLVVHDLVEVQEGLVEVQEGLVEAPEGVHGVLLVLFTCHLNNLVAIVFPKTLPFCSHTLKLRILFFTYLYNRTGTFI